MQTKTTVMGTTEWTVHGETGSDVILKRKIWSRVFNPKWAEDDPEFDRWNDFIDVYVQSENVCVPFEWPAFTTDPDVLLPTRNRWLALPGTVYRKWKDDIAEVDLPPGDIDLLPPEMLDPKGEATLMSPVNEPPLEPLSIDTLQEN